MAERTNQTFYLNEVRSLEITVRDQDGNEYAPSAAYVEVWDENGLIVIAEQIVQVTGNKVNTIIGTSTTASPGTYYIIWRLLRSGYTYYHVTELEVQKLI